MLTIDNLSISRNDIHILQGFGASLFPGCALNIYGPNGSGKTILLQKILGLDIIKPKQIFYNQVDVFEHVNEYRLMGEYVGHNLGLKEILSVEDNLSFWARIYDTKLLLAPAIHTLNLSKYLKYKISELSMGTKKRVALARLLITNSTLWFLDEPFANLDTDFINILQNMIKARCEQKGIVIFTSHTPLEGPEITNISINDFKEKDA